ncbi:MAG: circularly permuted type 2 ATP-grasp protein [Proteobacteria bacterium]|nr:circularly permuted type 2 ATP-grasp protein [Pseudomonadota bacterium]
MISPTANHLQDQSSLFNTLAFPRDAYCEAFIPQGQCREHWLPLVKALNATGIDSLNKRQDRVRRMRHEDGATFNPFDDPNQVRAPWALDIIPMPIAAKEWAVLEAGLIQRARLLELVLGDIYGSQSLIHGRQMPAELIFANPNFLRHCHGTKPTGNRFLTFYAADLYRGPDGRFRVLRDYGSNPAGLGYALENRIVISRVFQKFYHQTQICRLAPFFQTFHNNLIRRAALQQEDPRIVLLSPGPDSPIYFEHALLSRYLNYPLVEGQDLTVRNGDVFLKKLSGLEPVEAIFRHIPDNRSDPFALRRGTATGVAGLIQVSRDQNIDITNPIGSGFIDTPALSTLLPDLCRHLLDEDLALENHPAWWCKSLESRNHVLANLKSLNLGPAFDRSRTKALPENIKAAIEAESYAFMAQEPLCPSTVPVWDKHGVNSRYALLRVFLCASQEGFVVMPGGLAITAPDVNTLSENYPERQQSKDLWVYSDRPVEPFSLMDGMHTTTEFRRGRDLPSRVADHLLWLGRYLERAEVRVRLLRSVFRRITGEDRLADIPELPFLLDLMATQETIQLPEEKNIILRYRQLWDQLQDALYRKDRPGSLAAVLNQVQGAARNVRDWFSVDSWRVINRLDEVPDSPVEYPLEHLDETLYALSAFSGLAMESMTRGLGWRFMDMGRRIERAMIHTNLIRAGLSQLYEESRSKMEALLEVAASIMTYRSRYRTTFQLAPVLDLLLIDESNPKSLAFQCSQLADHVEQLPRQHERRFASPEERMALDMLTSVRLLDLSTIGSNQSDDENLVLSSFLESMEERLKNFAQAISAHYLARVPVTPHYSVITGEAKS